MWEGPYGNWGSRKYLMSSLNQSLKRMNLGMSIFSIPIVTTPKLHLKKLFRRSSILSGKVKPSTSVYPNTPKEKAEFAYRYLEERDVHCLLYQGRYNLFNREPEEQGILQQAKENGTGFIAFSPLAQGLLTNRYLNGIRKTQE